MSLAGQSEFEPRKSEPESDDPYSDRLLWNPVAFRQLHSILYPPLAKGSHCKRDCVRATYADEDEEEEDEDD